MEVRYLFAGLQPQGPDADLARGGFALVILAAFIGNVGGYLLFRARLGSPALGKTL